MAEHITIVPNECAAHQTATQKPQPASSERRLYAGGNYWTKSWFPIVTWMIQRHRRKVASSFFKPLTIPCTPISSGLNAKKNTKMAPNKQILSKVTFPTSTAFCSGFSTVCAPPYHRLERSTQLFSSLTPRAAADMIHVAERLSHRKAPNAAF